MKTSIILTLLIITLGSCMYSGMDDDYTSIDPKLRPYLKLFIKEASSRGIYVDTVNLKLVFGKSGKEGVTYYDTKTIIIDSTSYSWKHLPECLLMHEFGHLFLYRKHDDRLLQNGLPKSLMTSKAIPILYIENNMGYYFDELFTLHK